MQISDERLKEFQRIYREAEGEEITLDQAREMAQRLLTLFKILYRPLPGEDASPSSPRSPAQTER